MTSSHSSEADAAAGGSTSVNKMTKRQRRKQGPNPRNTWPQQPNLTSPQARAKAYLRVAGLGDGAASKLDEILDWESPELKFGRLLGSTNQRVRHAAVTKLQQWLRARCDIHQDHGISELDLLRLWKALWYTLYMCDKVVVQEELSARLAKLIWCLAGTEEEDEYAGQAYLQVVQDENDSDDEEDVIMEEIVNTLEQDDSDKEEEEEEEHVQDDEASDESLEEEEEEDQDNDVESLEDYEVPHCRGAHLASLWLKTFFITVRREWGNMDKYRIDKFYTLIRLTMSQVYQYMAKRHWNMGIVRLLNDTIFEQVLVHTPNGLRFHLVDLCLEELAKVNATADSPLTEATLLDVLEPYFALLQTSDDALVHDRIMEKILSRFLMEYSVVSDCFNYKGNDEAKSLVFDQVHVGTVADFIFHLGGHAETQDRYRQSLYSMYKTYVRRLKKVGHDVDLGDDDDDDDEEGMFRSPEEQEPEEPQDLSPQRNERDAVREAEDAAEVIPEKKAGKKHKKKKKNSEKNNTDTHKNKPNVDAITEHGDQEIVISLGEQARAKDATKLSSSKKKRSRKDSGASDGSKKKRSRKDSDASDGSNNKKKKSNKNESRRVSFGRKNSMKSYKASMRDLARADPKPEPSPNSGILRKRPTTKSSSGKKKKKN